MNLPVSLGFMGFFWISQKVELESISAGCGHSLVDRYRQ
jgi:hypothetical protein